jgi:hypothetical protein
MQSYNSATIKYRNDMSKEEYHINLSLQRVLLTGYSSCYIVIILYDVPDSGSLLRKTFQEIC